LPTPDSAQIDSDVTALAFKRKAYWHNANRNDNVAAVARAFVKQDLGKLGEYGVTFLGYEPMLRHAPDTKVAVLVASTEQARELHKRLPGWKIVDAVPNSGGGKVAHTDVGMMETPGMIITETAAGKDGLVADVVIRAGGSTGRLCFNGFPPPLDNDTREAVVMDFVDEFDERAALDAKRRRREYDLLGWEMEPD
jgi:hypothetical protein